MTIKTSQLNSLYLSSTGDSLAYDVSIAKTDIFQRIELLTGLHICTRDFIPVE